MSFTPLIFVLYFQPDLVIDGDILVKEDWHNVPHVVANLLSFCISSHRKILLHLNEENISYTVIQEVESVPMARSCSTLQSLSM